jgi:hypothetical protein
MIVHYFHVIGVTVPTEAYAPLVVDPNAVLTGPIASKRFETITRWNAKVIQPHRCINQLQLASRDTLDCTEPANSHIRKQLLGVAVPKASDH